MLRLQTESLLKNMGQILMIKFCSPNLIQTLNLCVTHASNRTYWTLFCPLQHHVHQPVLWQRETVARVLWK